MLNRDSFTPLSISAYVLILANVIPLIGVLFFSWDTQTVIALYWIENLIIGALYIVRIGVASAVQKSKQGLFLIGFFCLHYGAFCSAHGLFLVKLIGFEEQVAAVSNQSNFDGLFSLFGNSVHTVSAMIEHLSPAITLGIVVILLSRSVSFIENFILRGEVFTSSPSKLMSEPYSQIMVMHVGLIAGAMVLTHLNDPVWLLAIIVVFKILVDYFQHVRRHKNKQAKAMLKEQIKDF